MTTLLDRSEFRVSLDSAKLLKNIGGVAHRTLDASIDLGARMRHERIGIVHWLHVLAETPGSDFVAILRHFGIEPARVTKLLVEELESMDRAEEWGLSTEIEDLIRESCLLAWTSYRSPVVRSGHLLLTLLQCNWPARHAPRIARVLEPIDLNRLAADLNTIVERSAEAAESAAADLASVPSAVRGGAEPGGQPNLERFTIDLTEMARAGKIQPATGREKEIESIVRILLRSWQNNPMLLGEAGVGKTAVVEGLAVRIINDDVPPQLQGVSLRTLDVGLLQAGAGVRGEFEQRLRGVIDEVRAAAGGIILFVDEAHTLMGAGGAAGTGDAANLLKPALARGELRTIGATTWAEYKTHVEKDPAMVRRFQPVILNEPTEPVAVRMMRSTLDRLRNKHGVEILDEAIQAAVGLSRRYIMDRQLPDKCASVLDTACVRAILSDGSLDPRAITDLRREIEQLEREESMLAHETRLGLDHAARQTEIAEALESNRAELANLEARLGEERILADRVRELRRRLAHAPATAAADAEPAIGDDERPAVEAELRAAETALRELQGDAPLVHTRVDASVVREIVADWTGIPVGRIVQDDQKALNLEQLLGERIVGQPHVLARISECMRASRADLGDPTKPVGVFLFVGPTGVGKTETALALTELMYGSEKSLTVINMSEYQKDEDKNRLTGPPPGYVGYGMDGTLTGPIRKRPFGIVLLDEIEKAAEGIRQLFFQMFDKGMIQDGTGRDIDCRQTLFIMTSNAAAEPLVAMCTPVETRPDPDRLRDALKPHLLKALDPAFVERSEVIPFYPLGDAELRLIAQLQMKRLRNVLRDGRHRARLDWTEAAIDRVIASGETGAMGARQIRRTIDRLLVAKISEALLQRQIAGDPVAAVHVDADVDMGFAVEIL